MNNISYYNKMSILVYKYLLIISIIIVILGSVYYYKLPNTNSVLKIAIIWFCVLMVANLFNMYYILGKYQSNSNKIGAKGTTGIRGPKGFKGKSSTCGMICGSDGFNNCDESEKDENGICQTLADDIDDFGNSMYLSSEEGSLPRKKIRIRSYPSNLKTLDWSLEKKISSVEGRYKTQKILKKQEKENFLKNGYFDQYYGNCYPKI